AVVMDEVVNPDNMGMRQFQGPLRLMFKLVQQRTILDHQVGQKFQRDMALEFFIARQPHNSHSTSAKHLDQREAPKDSLSAARIPRRHEKTPWAASLRRVGGNFGSAVPADSAGL